VFMVTKADVCCESGLEWILKSVAMQTLCSGDYHGRVYSQLS
jgi:hypothetical protein